MSLANKIFENGVVGAGGAGFPTHVKAQSEVEYILANGAECEPLIHKDFELMIHYPDQVVKGMELMMQSTGASKGIFGIKAKNKKAVESIKNHLPANIKMLEMGDFYPAGDEYELVNIGTGRLIPPGGIPLNVGCVVNNVETFFNISNAMNNIPVTMKMVSVTGCVKEPKSFFVPIGTSFRDLIKFAGGLTIQDYAILVSGILMGGMTFDIDEVVTKTCAGIIVMPKDHYLINIKNKTHKEMNRIGKSACDQCSACTEFCPRYLLGYDVQPHKVMRSLEFTTSGEGYWSQFAEYCCSCGLCTLYSCPEGLYPREACDQAKVIMKNEGIKYKQSKEVKVHPFKDGRRVPIKSLLKKLRIYNYEVPTPFVNDIPTIKEVKIKLKQHVGAPAVPVIQKGQFVTKGQLIADIDKGSLGAKIHASINGIVSDINQDFIKLVDQNL